MKIKFNGVKEKSRKGCSVCGGKSSRMTMTTSKTYYLPSGTRMTFRVGRIENVSDADGQFLLSFNDVNNEVFSVWRG